ncbi:hypothetical protein LG3211_0299 [Lysobacter gummosus]|nr:hypothetical protein LG3211_0299 [Lysobacter gummosus]
MSIRSRAAGRSAPSPRCHRDHTGRVNLLAGARVAPAAV